MTKAQFRLAATRAFRQANPGTVVTIEWDRCHSCEWFDGSAGYSGSFLAISEAFRTRHMMATYSPSQGLMVR